MVLYSAKSREKVFHLPHCKIARRIRKAYKKQFASQEEARATGYRMCSCCSPVGMRFNKERRAVKRFCQEHKISCWLEDGQLHIHTARSMWRIIVHGKNNKLALFHQNTLHEYDKTPSEIPGYHFQSVHCKTIVAYLEDIVHHDIFRRRQDKKDRRQSKQKMERKRSVLPNKQPYQRRKDNRHYNKNQLCSIIEDLYY